MRSLRLLAVALLCGIVVQSVPGRPAMGAGPRDPHHRPRRPGPREVDAQGVPDASAGPDGSLRAAVYTLAPAPLP